MSLNIRLIFLDCAYNWDALDESDYEGFYNGKLI